MRIAPPRLLPLFRSEMQLRMLGLLFENPSRSWTADELRGSVEASASSLHRELHRAMEAGLVSRNDAVRPHQYTADTTNPLYEPIHALLIQTVGVESELRSILAELNDVDAAVIHGSWASGAARAGSDVDLLVVGPVNHDEVIRATRGLSRRLGRRIDTLVFDAEDLRRRRDQGFVKKLLEGPRIELVGDLEGLLAAP